MQRAGDTGDAATSAGRSSGAAAAACAAGLFVIAFAVVLATRATNQRALFDQDVYHLRAIRTFARQWPRPDFHDYASATTPLYHLLIALVDRYVTDSVTALRVVGATFTVGMLATLGWVVGRRISVPGAVALCLPVVTSLYTFPSGAWLLPDNAGWWGVIVILAIALDGRFTRRTYIAAAIALLALVLVRQVHLWCAGVLVFAAWLGTGDDADRAASSASRYTRVLAMLAASVPAAIAVGAFMLIWRGPMPPSMAEAIRNGYVPAEAGVRISGPNWATPGAVLVIAGITGVFFTPILLPAIRAGRVGARWLLVGAAMGLAIGAAPHSSYEFGTRSGGFWNAIHALPTFADRSPAFIALAALGGAVLAAWAQALDRRDAWILGAAYGCFVLSQLPNPSAFQRYFEPFVLIVWALAASRIASRDGAPRFAWAGPLALALLLGAVTALSLAPAGG